MQSYSIKYRINNKDYDVLIDAKSLKSAREKLGKRHGYKTGRLIKVIDYSVVGYF